MTNKSELAAAIAPLGARYGYRAPPVAYGGMSIGVPAARPGSASPAFAWFQAISGRDALFDSPLRSAPGV